MKRALAVGLVVALLGAAQVRAADESTSTKKPPLPPKWGKLKLSDEQKTKVRSIRAEYASRIEALQQQIAALHKQEKAALYQVLTESQRARLKEILTDEPSTAEVKSTEKTTEKPRTKP